MNQRRRETLTKLELFDGKWAAKYYEVFTSPLAATNKYITEWLFKYLPSKTESFIIDAFCGAGLTGLQLHLAGLKNIDGTDLKENMIKQAKQKRFYRHLFKDCITLFGRPGRPVKVAILRQNELLQSKIMQVAM